jgi:hypothetical protein
LARSDALLRDPILILLYARRTPEEGRSIGPSHVSRAEDQQEGLHVWTERDSDGDRAVADGAIALRFKTRRNKLVVCPAPGKVSGSSREYLRGRAAVRQQRISERIARTDDPRERILAVFDLLGELATAPSFRGCAFVNASAEGPRDRTNVTRVCDEMRTWLRGLFTDLARDAGVARPERLGVELVLLYDGATVGASMDHDAGRAEVARSIAAGLLDAAASGEKRSRRAPAPRA